MMRMRRVVCVAVVAATGIVIAAGCARLNVYRGFQSKKEGVVYRLPRAVLLVNVPIVKTAFQHAEKGALKPYAETLESPFEGLPIVKIPSPLADIDDGTIVTRFRFSNIGVTPVVEPDPNHVYFVELTGDATQNRMLKLNLSRLGVLIDAHSTVQDRKLELLLATAQAAVRVGTSIAGAAASRSDAFAAPDPNKQKCEFGRLPAAGKRAYYLRSALQTIDDTRVSLFRNATDVSKDAIETMLRELGNLEQQIIDQFFTINAGVHPLVFEVRPNPNAWIDPTSGAPSVERIWTLLELDAKVGVRWASGCSCGGAPCPHWPIDIGRPDEIPFAIRADQSGTENDKTHLVLRLTHNANHGVPGAGISRWPTGFVYRIPGAVDVSISEWAAPGKLAMLHFDQTFQIPQAGVTAALPRHAGLSPESDISIALYEETGALKNLNVSSKSIDPSIITGFGESVGTSVDKLAETYRAVRELDAAEPSKFEKITANVKAFTEMVQALKDAGLPIPAVPDPTNTATQ